MKPIKSISNPTNLLFFDTETQAHRDDKDQTVEYHRLWFGYALAYRREKQHHTREMSIFFDTSDQFWEFLISRLDKERPLWVFAHNIPFDLTIVNAWLSGDNYGISVDLPILDDPPIIIACHHDCGKMVFVDTFNYWKSSVSEIGESLGIPKLTMPTHKILDDEWRNYCKMDVTIISSAIDRLLKWLEDNSLGSLRYTTPSIAMNIFKTKFLKPNTIEVHNNNKALKLEREAYHGGLVMPYKIGYIKGPIYKYDVNSLYPYMMKNLYPVRLIEQYSRITPDLLLKKMEHLGAVSNVTIHSDDYPYPVVWQSKLIEAVGTFTIPLCGAELLHALEHGHVKSCGLTFVYRMEDIFTEYVEYFWNLRKQYKQSKDKVNELFCKLMLNSLYGKFGQQSHIWYDLTYNTLAAIYAMEGLVIPDCYETEDSIPTWTIGVHYWRPLGFPYDLTIRVLPNNRQVKVPAGEHRESCPIISAYVTSYARSYMRTLREIAGRNNVYYTDTDSLFVNEEGSQRLKSDGWVDDKTLGSLKLEGIEDSVIINGPKDYKFGQVITIKGIRKNATQIGDNTFQQVQFEGLKSVLKRYPEPYITVSQITKTLSREMTKGVVKKDGWVDYIRLDLM
ncbi:MAG: DNA polymerase [Candidatus Nitrosotenuis sp.]